MVTKGDIGRRDPVNCCLLTTSSAPKAEPPVETEPVDSTELGCPLEVFYDFHFSVLR